ncbi:MAG: transcriptional repressor LexA [Dehalococcoidia bacterium]|nr:transcriptional repressor LexA [Dehalococcoidia bacterium]
MRRGRLPITRERIKSFIHWFVGRHGYAPTVREIMKGLGISSTSVVQYHLNVLEREGFIKRDREVFRSIQLTEGKRIATVPVLGSIAAGEPLPVISAETWTSEVLEMIDVPEELTRGKEVYALRVKGRSMVDALIDDGDIVLIEPASTADNGEMVVARLRNEHSVTLKRLYRDGQRVRLQPANGSLPPTYTVPENLQVQGRGVGVIRKL